MNALGIAGQELQQLKKLIVRCNDFGATLVVQGCAILCEYPKSSPTRTCVARGRFAVPDGCDIIVTTTLRPSHVAIRRGFQCFWGRWNVAPEHLTHVCVTKQRCFRVLAVVLVRDPS